MNIAMFSDSYYPYVSGVVRSIELFRHELNRDAAWAARPESRPKKSVRFPRLLKWPKPTGHCWLK